MHVSLVQHASRVSVQLAVQRKCHPKAIYSENLQIEIVADWVIQWIVDRANMTLYYDLEGFENLPRLTAPQ
jgi:hypothetical protein